MSVYPVATFDPSLVETRKEAQAALTKASLRLAASLKSLVEEDLTQNPSCDGCINEQHAYAIWKRINGRAPGTSVDDVNNCLNLMYEDGWVQPLGAEGYLTWRWNAEGHRCYRHHMTNIEPLEPPQGLFTLKAICAEAACQRAWKGYEGSNDYIDWYPMDGSRRPSDFDMFS